MVFAKILDRLISSDDCPAMIELGCWWSFYSLWFRRVLPASRVVAVEPDLEYLNVARRHFALNDESADFVHGGIAAGNAPTLQFLAQSDGRVHDVPQHDLAQLLAMHGLERASLVLADIQGAETALIEGARDVLADGRIRFMLVSTHHHSISGDPLTHQRTLTSLRELGAHVIAEHSVGESYSGDGLVAVSFDPADRDFEVAISRARQCESLFGELEPELANAQLRAWGAESALTDAERSVRELAVRIAELETDRNETRNLLAAMEQTKTWRWSRSAIRNRARILDRLRASGILRAR